MLHAMPGEALFGSFFDASLGKSEAMTAQQAEVHFLTGMDIKKNSIKTNLLEFHSNKVHRVVRSNLAVESFVMTSAADKILYNRALFGALFHGQEVVAPQWRQELMMGDIIIPDAKDLNDHVNKIGNMANEKLAAVDILMAKHLAKD